VLQVINLRKEYPGTVALDDVSIDFHNGQVHALLGKNGAGKSTLIKILAGAVKPTSGKILVDGKPVELDAPADAFANGIVTVHQELSLVPQLSVAENILLGRLPRGAMMIDWRQVFERARQILGEMHVDIDVKKRACELGVAQQQIVEIAKAMSLSPAALLLDEPTSALAHHETKSLFDVVRKLASKGVAIVYITHRLHELVKIADAVTVLRDGRFIGTRAMSDAPPATIVHMMFGQTVPSQRPAELKAGNASVLSVRKLGKAGRFSGVNFELREGEVLGIAGMLGAGRTELLKAIFGAEPFDEGEVETAGKIVRSPTPALMRSLGIAFTPENRKEEALVQMLSTRANMCLAAMGSIATSGFITKPREKKFVNEKIERLQIKVADIEHPVSSLSGGNQQKVVIGNWLNTLPRVILFDEPTRGVDVQAKQQIFRVMWDLASQGISSVFVSSELEELIEVCHRILIMKNGTLVGEVRPDELSADELVVRCMSE
jgi:ribose transport system ATP-binding protein